MSECPFCNASVPNSLVLHGGTCPQCFAEIPGEETATDPGEEVKAQLAAADQQRAQRRTMLPALVGGPVVLLIALVAAWRFWPAPEVELLDFADDEFEIDLASLAQYVEPEPEPEPEATAAASAASPKRSAQAAKPAPRPASGGTSEAGTPEPVKAGAALGGGGGFDLALQTRRTAALLTSKDDISQAIRDLFNGHAPRLQQCYERSLKGAPDLHGQWRLSFTIEPTGKVSGASATGVDMANADLEACFVREMGTWSIYGRLEKPRPVVLPINFKGRD